MTSFNDDIDPTKVGSTVQVGLAGVNTLGNQMHIHVDTNTHTQ